MVHQKHEFLQIGGIRFEMTVCDVRTLKMMILIEVTIVVVIVVALVIESSYDNKCHTINAG